MRERKRERKEVKNEKRKQIKNSHKVGHFYTVLKSKIV